MNKVRQYLSQQQSLGQFALVASNSFCDPRTGYTLWFEWPGVRCRPPKVPDSHIGGEFAAESTGGQISSRLLSMRSANTLLEFPAAKGMIPKGSMVSALLIQDLAGMPISEHLTTTASPAHYEYERKFEGFSQD